MPHSPNVIPEKNKSSRDAKKRPAACKQRKTSFRRSGDPNWTHDFAPPPYDGFAFSVDRFELQDKKNMENSIQQLEL
jgi:hypothetical protein